MPDAEPVNESDSEPQDTATEDTVTEDTVTEDTATEDTAPEKPARTRVFSAYGVVSAVLGVVSVAAIVVGVLLWSGHRSAVEERQYEVRAKKAAVQWTLVLINMTKDNLDGSLARLHDDTAGGLNADFDATLAPYRELVQRLATHTGGRIESVALQSVSHDLGDPGAASPPPEPAPGPAPVGTRTDTVQVLATSLAGNGGAKPQAVNWNLLVDVSDVDGRLLISRLQALR